MNKLNIQSLHAGGNKIWLCGLCQYVNLFGVSIGYTITAGLSAA